MIGLWIIVCVCCWRACSGVVVQCCLIPVCKGSPAVAVYVYVYDVTQGLSRSCPYRTHSQHILSHLSKSDSHSHPFISALSSAALLVSYFRRRKVSLLNTNKQNNCSHASYEKCLSCRQSKANSDQTRREIQFCKSVGGTILSLGRWGTQKHYPQLHHSLLLSVCLSVILLSHVMCVYI